MLHVITELYKTQLYIISFMEPVFRTVYSWHTLKQGHQKSNNRAWGQSTQHFRFD